MLSCSIFYTLGSNPNTPKNSLQFGWCFGEVAERFKVFVLKTNENILFSVGSNPTFLKLRSIMFGWWGGLLMRFKFGTPESKGLN